MGANKASGFTDIHTHLFPAVDDGAPDIESTLDLARIAWENGTTRLFLTPHYCRRFSRKSSEWYRENFEPIRERIQSQFPDMELFLGSEITFEMDVPEMLSEGKILSLNDSGYVLLELRADMNAQGIVNAVYETVRNGFTPILAHVDRFEIFRKQPELTDRAIDNGALIQLNADSVMGKHGFFVKRFSHRLIRENKAHFIASDAHNAANRPPNLGQCYQMIAKQYGVETAERLFSQNARVLFVS